jgi:hypothetical protein
LRRSMNVVLRLLVGPLGATGPADQRLLDRGRRAARAPVDLGEGGNAALPRPGSDEGAPGAPVPATSCDLPRYPGRTGAARRPTRPVSGCPKSESARVSDRLLRFAAAQRLRCASAIRARPAADIRCFLRGAVRPAAAGTSPVPILLRRFWMSAIAVVMVDSCEAYPTNAASSRDLSSWRAMVQPL